MRLDCNDLFAILAKCVEQLDQAVIILVADDDIDFRQLCRILRKRLCHAAGQYENGVGMLAAQLMQALARFAVRLGGHGAGVDDIDIGVFLAVNNGIAVLREGFRHHAAFILIHLAP